MKTVCLLRRASRGPSGALIVFSLGLATAAPAAINVDFIYDQMGTGATQVTFSANGMSGTVSQLGIQNDLSYVRSGGVTSTVGFFDSYLATGTPNGAWASVQTANSRTGSNFGFGPSGFRVPVGYNLLSGDTITGSMTWENTSLIQLGFASNAPAFGSFAAAGTTVNWTANVGAIPEAASFAVVGGVMGLFAAGFKRRRRQAV